MVIIKLRTGFTVTSVDLKLILTEMPPILRSEWYFYTHLSVVPAQQKGGDPISRSYPLNSNLHSDILGAFLLSKTLMTVKLCGITPAA